MYDSGGGLRRKKMDLCVVVAEVMRGEKVALCMVVA